METGRRFGNQVGDPLRFQPRDLRSISTMQAVEVRRLIPTGPWGGYVLGHVDAKYVGSFSAEPFYVPVPNGKRSWLEFFLAGIYNADEDVRRYLRPIPGDRVKVAFQRFGTGQESFRVYYTAGIGGAPDRLVAEYETPDRVSGATADAAFEHVSDVLSAGGHSFQVRPTDRAGNEKTGCLVLTCVLTPWPQPPTGVEVHAFVRTTGLVTLKWSPAADQASGSLYSVYRNQGHDTRVQYGTAAKTVATAFPTTGVPPKVYATFALPFTGPAAEGTWLAGVRHTKGGIEEDNVSALARFVLSTSGGYAGGGYPYAPSYTVAVPTAGGRIVVKLKHDNLNEPNAALRFRVYRSPMGVSTVDFGSPVGTIERSTDRLFEASTAIGPLTHGGLFRFTVRSEATAGLREVNTAVCTAIADAQPPANCPTALAISPVIG